MTRQEIYAVIDGERAYQQKKWGGDHKHEAGAFIALMEHYLHLARQDFTMKEGDQDALHQLRKVVALGIACFEQHGVPQRGV